MQELGGLSEPVLLAQPGLAPKLCLGPCPQSPSSRGASGLMLMALLGTDQGLRVVLFSVLPPSADPAVSQLRLWTGGSSRGKKRGNK